MTRVYFLPLLTVRQFTKTKVYAYVKGTANQFIEILLRWRPLPLLLVFVRSCFVHRSRLPSQSSCGFVVAFAPTCSDQIEYFLLCPAGRSCCVLRQEQTAIYHPNTERGGNVDGLHLPSHYFTLAPALRELTAHLPSQPTARRSTELLTKVDQSFCLFTSSTLQ